MTCPDCKGKGGYLAEDGFPEHCDKCEATGRITEDGYEWVDCPKCDGDGWINSNEPDEFDAARDHATRS